MSKDRYSIYLRRCRRCQEFFKTPQRLGKVCYGCRRPPGRNKLLLLEQMHKTQRVFVGDSE